MTFVRRVAVRWGDVRAGDTVILQEKPWQVVKSKLKDARRVKVTVERKGEIFSANMPIKAQVMRVEPIATKPWSEPDTPAEKVVEEVLGATLEAVKPSDDEVYVVPPIDVSTIASHMLIFHGIELVDVRRVGGWEEARAQHDAEHERDIDDLHVPHRHDAGRPVVDIGPRFH
jgi:hypothetical protein